MGEKKEIDELVQDMVTSWSMYTSSLMSVIKKLEAEIEQLRFDISVIRADYELCQKPSSGMAIQDPCLNDSGR